MRTFIIMLFLITSTAAAGNGFDHSHKAFTQILQQHVIEYDKGLKSVVDYTSLHKNSEPLDEYLSSLSSVQLVQYEQWERDEQLAFLINAYNAFTLQLIINHYERFESGKAQSIRDLGGFFTSPWKLDFFELLEEPRTLDWLEHEKIRVDFEEPRIHAALVCAAVSCPKLRAEAFAGNNLDTLLENQMISFLSDRDKNGIDNRGLYLSKIFDWYEDDFGNLTRYMQSFANALADSAEDQARLTGDIRIRYVSYNWDLNSIENQ